ncbi:hypothetical protein [Mucilaginibacter jinjuensis]|uniref:DUF8188 domain-containing protein n=1 Tax=Mucilaginibacter jinjuensis TaxID=1176721 RepID=A0ABY7TA97_9SPHI|nr:hypothetical protein [Mucilaginibacter jinjuensis]WCT13123.1 hypothetical protein PQO05_04140 [Mucilaginibacter jinjuensis]
MSKQYWIGFCVLAGMILAKILYPIIGNLTANMSANKVSTTQVQEYINQSKPIQLKYDSYKSGYSTYSNVMHTKHLMRSYYAFYDPSHKKYYSIQMFDTYALDGLLDDLKNSLFTCFINEQQLGNPDYGSAQNPIPILRCDINIKDAWKSTDVNAIRDYKKFKSEYKNAVFDNLTYFTPKEEFQKMFPEQK